MTVRERPRSVRLGLEAGHADLPCRDDGDDGSEPHLALTLAYEELAITAEPGLVLLIYTAEPGSPSAERLHLLASWAAPALTA
jgi:hypothetical protein